VTKKFFKTYYSIPDKHNRIDVVFERGYKNIQVLYNGTEIGNYPSASLLTKSTQLQAPDESLIHIRFLKDTTDFEVFFNAVQIDNSETKPETVVNSLKWPVYVCLAWYASVIIFFCIRTNAVEIISRYPDVLITDPRVLYSLTSSMVAALVLIIGLATLRSGNALFYYLTMVVVLIDSCYGLIMPFAAPIMVDFQIDFTLFLFLFPLAIKSVVLWVYFSNLKSYKQYIFNKSTIKRKTNTNIVDLS